MAQDQTLPYDSKMELPPLVAPKEALPNNQPEMPVKQLGTERNPELLPAFNKDDPSAVPEAQAAVSQAGRAQHPQGISNTKPGPVKSVASPAIADDIDLIEKEWVEKAKAIVERTKDDPHKQNSEINKMKADYLKKRYNKTVQVSE